jgi:hypothetical protein
MQPGWNSMLNLPKQDSCRDRQSKKQDTQPDRDAKKGFLDTPPGGEDGTGISSCQAS